MKYILFMLLLLVGCASPTMAELQPSKELTMMVDRTIDAWVTPRLLIDPDHFQQDYQDLDAWATPLWNIQSLRDAITSSHLYNGEDVDRLIIDGFDRIQ